MALFNKVWIELKEYVKVNFDNNREYTNYQAKGLEENQKTRNA